MLYFEKITKKFRNFEQKSLEKPGIITFFTCLVVKFRFDSKRLSYIKKCIHQFFFIKNIFKVALPCLFDDSILLNTVSYLKIKLKLKIDPKT